MARATKLPEDFSIELGDDPGMGMPAKSIPIVDYLERLNPKAPELVHKPSSVSEPPQVTTITSESSVKSKPELKNEIEKSLLSRPKSKRTPRLEVTLDQETLRKIQELLKDVQTKGPQSDASTAELIRALVVAAYEARHKMDYSGLTPRGQWGSATADAYQAGIKEVYAAGIAIHYHDRRPILENM